MNAYKVEIHNGLVTIDRVCMPDKVIGGGLCEKEKKAVSDLQPGQTVTVGEGEIKITRIE